MTIDRFADIEARRRGRFLECSLPEVHVPADSMWGQGETQALERLHSAGASQLFGFHDGDLWPELGLAPGPGTSDGEMSIGTFMSAFALASTARDDDEIRQRLWNAVDQVVQFQSVVERNGGPAGYVGPVPVDRLDPFLHGCSPAASRRVWQEIGSILAGLLDAARYAQDEWALDAAIKLGDWLDRLGPGGSVARLASSEDGNGPTSSGWRHAVPVALAYLAMVTGQARGTQVAALSLGGHLAGVGSPDEAACRIDAALSTISLFVLGDDSAFDRVCDMWHDLHQSYIGPAGSLCAANDPFGEYGPFGQGKGAQSSGKCCVGCATYRMIELTAMMLACEPDTRYADYLEIAIANFVAATAPSWPDDDVAREVPFGPGVRIDRRLPKGSCCGINSTIARLRLRQSIFSLLDDEISINLYVSATLAVPGSGSVELSRLAANRYRIDIEGDPPGKLRIRWPSYAMAMRLTTDNGTWLARTDEDGYVVVPGEIADGESIEVSLDWDVDVIRSPLDPARFAIRYGPWVLAALSDERTSLTWSPDEVGRELRRIGPTGPWRFDGVPLVPLRVVGSGPFHSLFLDPAQ